MESHTDTIIEKTESHFFPVFNRNPLVVDKASGCLVWDVDGKEYIDLTSGWGVTTLGHSHPALIEAISEQLGLCMQAPNCNLSYTIPQAEAAELLCEISPPELTRVFFTNCGSEAVEGAIKLAAEPKISRDSSHVGTAFTAEPLAPHQSQVRSGIERRLSRYCPE